MNNNKNIKIKYHISEQAVYRIPQESVDPAEMYGGLQILINGKRLNLFVGEKNINFGQDWYPEYIGNYLQTDLIELIKESISVANGSKNIYDVSNVGLRSTVVYLLIEPVAPQQVRVAVRTRFHRSLDPSDQLLVVPESACGYLVNRCTFCRAVSDVGHRYLNDINSMNLIGNKTLIEEFENALTELDSVLEDCEQTPTKIAPNKQC